MKPGSGDFHFIDGGVGRQGIDQCPMQCRVAFVLPVWQVSSRCGETKSPMLFVLGALDLKLGLKACRQLLGSFKLAEGGFQWGFDL